jgi:hypothetical protein
VDSSCVKEAYLPKHLADREKITVSLPTELVRYADQRAAALGITRSQFIGQAMVGLRAQEEEQLAREGYLFYADESCDFAAVALAAVWEAIERADATGTVRNFPEAWMRFRS